MTRVLVCGGRDFSRRDDVFKMLDSVHRRRGITCIIHGGASNADSFAEQWAVHNEVTSIRDPAKWKSLGGGAGPIRNRKMVVDWQPDLVIAFPGGSGTDSMVSIAKTYRIELYDFR